MARYNPHHETTAIFSVVERWVDQCLIHDYALLGPEAETWSFETVAAVRRRFRENPYAGPESFLTKLRRQLEDLDDRAIQLAAEILYVMLLFPSNIKPPKKRQNLREILEWRRRSVPINEDLLKDVYLTGIGSAGIGYNQKRPEEFGCFLDIVIEVKQLALDERREVLASPWAFSKFLTRVNATNRQLPHILQHLLFPDTFERISSGTDKRQLILGLTSDDPKKVKAMDREARDRRLLNLREAIAADRGDNQFDFYEPPYSYQWREPPESRPSRSVRSHQWADLEGEAVWLEVTSIAHGHGGEGWGLGQWLWSPTTSRDGADRYSVMRRPKPGDRVFHFVGGLLENQPRKRFLWGRSRVASDPAEVGEPPPIPGEWADAKSYYKIAVADLERIDHPRPVDEIESEYRELILDDLAERPKHYPYARQRGGFKGVQGIYLAKLTSRLAEVLDSYFPAQSDPALPAYEGHDPEEPYTLVEAKADAFMPLEELEAILELWRAKSNIILQGAPGVGKSFIAQRLAYALMGAKARARVETVQFHQSYAYEDFVQGYRPTADRSFALRDGVFLRHCATARVAPDRPYVLIIDEINRGNLSKVFGELMLLIEHDKRGDDWAVRLTYAGPDEPAFSVPRNLFVIGMMNTADRSLSMVDYALRRRFGFISLRPQFVSPAFREHLEAKGVERPVVDRIVARMAALNEEIAADRLNLGAGFEIGHSFFVPDAAGAYGDDWYSRIVRTEILPLLEEYWFDAPKRVDDWRERLLSGAP